MELQFAIWQSADGFAVLPDIADQQNTWIAVRISSRVGLAGSSEIGGEPNLIFNGQIIVSKDEQPPINPYFPQCGDRLRLQWLP